LNKNEFLILQICFPTNQEFFLKANPFISGCWSPSTQQRPTFKCILSNLLVIAESNFTSVRDDCFKTMRDDWRLEIQEMFDDLKEKEKVCLLNSSWRTVLYKKKTYWRSILLVFSLLLSSFQLHVFAKLHRSKYNDEVSLFPND